MKVRIVSTGIMLSCWKHWSSSIYVSQVRIGQDIICDLTTEIRPQEAKVRAAKVLRDDGEDETAFLIFNIISNVY